MKRVKDDIPQWLMYLVIAMVILFVLVLLFAPGYDHSITKFPSFRR